MKSHHATLRPTTLIAFVIALLCAVDCSLAEPGPTYTAGTNGLATVQQMLDAREDLWGNAAMQQPDGASYEFFEKLLPPLRYVDPEFRFYPIVLCEPGATTKGRLIGNGSMINALARTINWHGETGIPVTFHIGMDRDVYGSDPGHLDGPRYERGYLPIIQSNYTHGDRLYAEEVFASTDQKLANHAVMFVRFTVPKGTRTKVEAYFEGAEGYTNEKGTLRDSKMKVIACCDAKWEWNRFRNTASAMLNEGESATLAIPTVPIDAPIAMSPQIYDDQRKICVDSSEALLARGTQIEVNEPVVTNARKATIIGNFMLLHGDDMRYSAGNQYAKLYIAEGGDAVRTMMINGYEADAKKMTGPLMDYTRKNLEFHQAALKLQMMAHIWFVTQDAAFIQSQRRRWEKEINVILNGREKSTGMLPREKYCGDIDTLVYSLNSNSNCWRALRDWSVVLNDLGEKEFAQKLDATQREYREKILAAIDKSARRDVTPQFVPIALSGEEDVHDPITTTRIGSYWNLMINYVLGSGVFKYDSPLATDIVKYMQTRGGLCMGMLRSQPGDSFWIGGGKTNDLYGIRYEMLILQRDDPERSITSFYGKLAQGFTRDTFIDGEGASITPLDEFGRQFYLPPNSAGNSNYLAQLRNLLVQDWDMTDDSRPDTLRLCYATPRRWLSDGSTIKVERAPTAFGEISFTVESHVNKGEIAAQIQLPPRPAEKAMIRLRLPKPHRLASATVNDQAAKMFDEETIDLTGMHGNIAVRAKMK